MAGADQTKCCIDYAALFKTLCLVVDTGIHSKGWNREQVVEFMRQSGAIDEPSIQSETDRYIAWPAQALAYKLGQLKFRELRNRARIELGARFDIRSFHDAMLNGGVLPLDLLDSRTDSWIRAQKRAINSAGVHGLDGPHLAQMTPKACCARLHGATPSSVQA